MKKNFVKFFAVMASAAVVMLFASCSKSEAYTEVTAEDCKAEWLNGEWKLSVAAVLPTGSNNLTGKVIFNTADDTAVSVSEDGKESTESIEKFFGIDGSEDSPGSMIKMIEAMNGTVEGDRAVMVASDHSSFKMETKMTFMNQDLSISMKITK